VFLFCGSNLTFAQSFDSTDYKDWKEITFPSIYERIKADELDTLKNKMLTDNDLEIRFWIIPAFDPIDGYIIKNINNVWSGLYVKQSSYLLSPLGDVINAFSSRIFNLEFVKIYGTNEIIPESGWEIFWKKLNNQNVLYLPDEYELNFASKYFDGVGFVVEILDGKNYRTYHYNNPMGYDYPECKAIWEIYNIFRGEFQ